jgi:hypothetical protein
MHSNYLTLLHSFQHFFAWKKALLEIGFLNFGISSQSNKIDKREANPLMDSMDHSLPCLMDGMGSLAALCDGEDLVIGITQCTLGSVSTSWLQQFSLNHHHQPRTKFHLIAVIFIPVAFCFLPFAFSYIPIFSATIATS